MAETFGSCTNCDNYQIRVKGEQLCYRCKKNLEATIVRVHKSHEYLHKVWCYDCEYDYDGIHP